MSSRDEVLSPRRSSRKRGPAGPTKNDVVMIVNVEKDDNAVVATKNHNDDEDDDEGRDPVKVDIKPTRTSSKARRKQVPESPRKRGRNRVTGLNGTTTKSPMQQRVEASQADSARVVVARKGLTKKLQLEEERLPRKGIEDDDNNETETDPATADDDDEYDEIVSSLKRLKKAPTSDTQTVLPSHVSSSRNSMRPQQKSTTKIQPASKYNEEEEYDDDVDDDVDDDSNGDESGNGSVDEDDDDDDDDDLKQSSPKKRGRKPKIKMSIDDIVCPHCKKEFSSLAGLNYHLARWVCRKEECPDAAIVEQSNRKRGRGKAHSTDGDRDKKKSKKFRGPVDERTCLQCNRVFTSVFGLEYHVKKNVCQQKLERLAPSTGESDGMILAMHPLQPGDRFVTMFGVVEVIKDDRATPTAAVPQNGKKENDKYVTEKGRLTERQTRAHVARSIRLRARRMKINSLYSSGKINHKSIEETYTTFANLEPHVQLFQPMDPSEPLNSFPERIVECIFIPDARQRSVGRDPICQPIRKKQLQEEDVLSSTTTVGQKQSCLTKLFLQRRFLHEPYHVDGSVYHCQYCNMKFGSQPGQKYHVENNVCLKRGATIKEKREVMEKKISDSANSLFEVLVAPAPHPGPKRLWTKKPKRKQDIGMYPEVLIALGFLFLPESKVENVLFVPDETEVPSSVPDLVVPDEVLQNLQEELKTIELKADNQKYGSMYSEVYRSLGFRKPGQLKVPGRVNDVGTKKRRRRASKPKPEPPPKPLPPIIDIQALVDEVDAGRYPSISRYTADAHQDRCNICKDGGDLYCCDFCNQVEHLSCLRERFTVKEPEPDEDFMCHNCILSILAKRKRAEKRRALKQEGDEEGRRLHQEDGSQADDRSGLYQSMASKGQQLNELVELLQDAQLRLRQACETSRLNNLRRQIIEAGY